MKKFLAVLLFASGVCFAQAPNCNLLNRVVSTAGPDLSYNNLTQQKCVVWKLMYYAEGFATLSIQVEVAPDNNGAPGAFVAVPAGNVVVGTNPLTAITYGSSTLQIYAPWVRVNLTATTGGPGFVNYNLIGNSYVNNSSPTTGGGSGGGAVFGPDAVGATPTQPPIQDSGVDGGGLIRRLAVTTGGSMGIGNIATGADGIPNTQLAGTGTAAALDLLSNAPFLFNGTNWNRQRAVSITNSAVLTGAQGAMLEEKSGRFSVLSTPAAGTQGTASSAGVAGQRRIADCVGFSASSIVAPVLTALKVNLIDGATGGTAIASWTVAINAATGQNVAPQMYCGLNLQNTTGNALTLEFSAALANLSESVTLIYYVIQ